MPLMSAEMIQAVEEAAAVLRRGGFVAFPTETVYGLGADAENPSAVARVFAVKGRPAGHPLIVHIRDAAQLDRWAVGIPAPPFRLAERFWPGPLTLILKRSARVPDVVTGGQDTVGLRVPDHPVAAALPEAFGGGIAAPSPNRFGRVSPTAAAHVCCGSSTGSISVRCRSSWPTASRWCLRGRWSCSSFGSNSR